MFYFLTYVRFIKDEKIFQVENLIAINTQLENKIDILIAFHIIVDNL